MNLGRIYLIGMPGSGKSFFGQMLTEELDYPLIDLDKAIEEQEGREISEIFAQEGEDYFRDVEHEVLQTVTESAEHLIISTGGGTPCFKQGIEYMNSHGTTVFLETERALLIERLAAKSHRPLVTGDTAQKVDDLLVKRLEVYKKAHISISHRDVGLFLDSFRALKS